MTQDSNPPTKYDASRHQARKVSCPFLRSDSTQDSSKDSPQRGQSSWYSQAHFNSIQVTQGPKGDNWQVCCDSFQFTEQLNSGHWTMGQWVCHIIFVQNCLINRLIWGPWGKSYHKSQTLLISGLWPGSITDDAVSHGFPMARFAARTLQEVVISSSSISVPFILGQAARSLTRSGWTWRSVSPQSDPLANWNLTT